MNVGVNAEKENEAVKKSDALKMDVRKKWILGMNIGKEKENQNEKSVKEINKREK